MLCPSNFVESSLNCFSLPTAEPSTILGDFLQFFSVLYAVLSQDNEVKNQVTVVVNYLDINMHFLLTENRNLRLMNVRHIQLLELNLIAFNHNQFLIPEKLFCVLN